MYIYNIQLTFFIEPPVLLQISTPIAVIERGPFSFYIEHQRDFLLFLMITNGHLMVLLLMKVDLILIYLYIQSLYLLMLIVLIVETILLQYLMKEVLQLDSLY